MKKRRFVIRTIRKGQVKINGRIFQPSTRWLEYDGRLDGKRYAFGLYWNGDEMASYAYLWGSEKAYRAAGDGQRRGVMSGANEAPLEIEPDEKGGSFLPWALWNMKRANYDWPGG